MQQKPQQLYHLLLKIPKGRVTTYSELAKKLKTSPRAVGRMLSRNPWPEKYPCYKVITSTGGLGGYSVGVEKKISLLKNDGIIIGCGRVIDFKKVLHKFKP